MEKLNSEKQDQDPYSVLGIKRGASEAEIKAAFRKLSKLHHPDKSGGSAEEFRKIADAYESLTNPKRKNHNDIFSSDPWFSFVFHSANMANKNGDIFRQLNIRISIEISPGLAFSGGEISIEYIKNRYSGANVSQSREKVSINIPRRVANGFRLNVPKMGNENGEKIGDLIVAIGYASTGSNYIIDRSGNIKIQIETPWTDILDGKVIEIYPFESKEKVSLKLDENSGTRHLYVLKGEGMKPNGNLIVEVWGVLPKNISMEDRRSILEVLKKYATLGL